MTRRRRRRSNPWEPLFGKGKKEPKLKLYPWGVWDERDGRLRGKPAGSGTWLGVVRLPFPANSDRPTMDSVQMKEVADALKKRSWLAQHSTLGERIVDHGDYLVVEDTDGRVDLRLDGYPEPGERSTNPWEPLFEKGKGDDAGPIEKWILLRGYPKGVMVGEFALPRYPSIERVWSEMRKFYGDKDIKGVSFGEMPPDGADRAVITIKFKNNLSERYLVLEESGISSTRGRFKNPWEPLFDKKRNQEIVAWREYDVSLRDGLESDSGLFCLPAHAMKMTDRDLLLYLGWNPTKNFSTVRSDENGGSIYVYSKPAGDKLIAEYFRAGHEDGGCANLTWEQMSEVGMQRIGWPSGFGEGEVKRSRNPWEPLFEKSASGSDEGLYDYRIYDLNMKALSTAWLPAYPAFGKIDSPRVDWKRSLRHAMRMFGLEAGIDLDRFSLRWGDQGNGIEGHFPDHFIIAIDGSPKYRVVWDPPEGLYSAGERHPNPWEPLFDKPVESAMTTFIVYRTDLTQPLGSIYVSRPPISARQGPGSDMENWAAWEQEVGEELAKGAFGFNKADGVEQGVAFANLMEMNDRPGLGFTWWERIGHERVPMFDLRYLNQPAVGGRELNPWEPLFDKPMSESELQGYQFEIYHAIMKPTLIGKVWMPAPPKYPEWFTPNGKWVEADVLAWNKWGWKFRREILKQTFLAFQDLGIELDFSVRYENWPLTDVIGIYLKGSLNFSAVWNPDLAPRENPWEPMFDKPVPREPESDSAFDQRWEKGRLPEDLQYTGKVVAVTDVYAPGSIIIAKVFRTMDGDLYYSTRDEDNNRLETYDVTNLEDIAKHQGWAWDHENQTASDWLYEHEEIPFPDPGYF